MSTRLVRAKETDRSNLRNKEQIRQFRWVGFQVVAVEWE